MIIKIKNLQDNQHELIGDIIGDSFSDDPVNRWVFKSQASMTSYFTKSAKKLYLPKGFCQATSDNEAGSMWLPAGVKKYIPLWNSIDIAISMFSYSGITSIKNGLAIDDGLTKKKPKGDYFYLFAIGARSGMQGKGYGGMLMEAGLKKVDQHHMPAYLESSKESNIAFYERYGFEVIDKFIPVKNCPPLWLMWRKAK
jgi:ribosomal protein S18 acetylase RimI-like enzyme